jgi:hypothetical protein
MAPHQHPAPSEIIAARYVDRFGAQAVYGRPLYFREMARIVAAEKVERAVNGRKHAQNVAQWVSDNLELYRILKDAEACANG